MYTTIKNTSSVIPVEAVVLFLVFFLRVSTDLFWLWWPRLLQHLTFSLSKGKAGQGSADLAIIAASWGQLPPAAALVKMP